MNNQLNLVGRVGKEPQLRTFDSGAKVAKFSVGVKEYTGKEKPPTLWFDVEAWNGLSDRVMAAVGSGRDISVSGRLAISEYGTTDVDGNPVRVSKPVVKLVTFHLIGAKPDVNFESKSDDSDLAQPSLRETSSELSNGPSIEPTRQSGTTATVSRRQSKPRKKALDVA